MKWIRERDALIAQTLAFVQSVSGRKGDLRQPDTAAAAEIVSIQTVAVAFEPPQADPPRQVAPTPQPLPVAPAKATWIASFCFWTKPPPQDSRRP